MLNGTNHKEANCHALHRHHLAPPYESGSLLLEAAAGCTHHRCKFCTLYDELPFRFRLSPLEDIEADLAEAQELLRGQLVQRVFLVGQTPLRFRRSG